MEQNFGNFLIIGIAMSTDVNCCDVNAQLLPLKFFHPKVIIEKHQAKKEWRNLPKAHRKGCQQLHADIGQSCLVVSILIPIPPFLSHNKME